MRRLAEPGRVSCRKSTRLAMPHFAAHPAIKRYVINLSEARSEENRPFGVRIFAVSPGDIDTGLGSNPSTNKRKAEQVVDTVWRAMRGTAPSVIDGAANTILAAVSSRVISKDSACR